MEFGFLEPAQLQVTGRVDALANDVRGLAGIFGGDKPVLQTVDRIEKLAPKWTHPMHGGSMTGDTLAHYIRALRTQPFTYEGMLLGRKVFG